MNRLAVVCCVLLICTVGVAPGLAVAHPHPEVVSTATAEQDAFNTGPLGCVNGVCHDDDLDLDQNAGLTDEELEQLIYRSMARVEELRGERFVSDVPVDVMSREEFREQRSSQTGSSTDFNRWNDQVWKALFIIEATDSSETAIGETVGSAVTGFYSPRNAQIVLITPDPSSPQINERTLIHELGHALQDQRHDLTGSQFRGETQDSDLAVTGVFEGEAVYLEQLYRERCDDGRWQCLDEPPRSGSGGSTANQGVLLTLLQPYSDGPAYIADVVADEGWAGVDDRMDAPPTTTTEIIHRQPVDSRPIEQPDEATAGWERYADQGIEGAEVAGEASIFVMFWYQASEYGADTIDPSVLRETSHPNEQRNYVSAPSAGWAGDELYPYRRGDDDGYVWTLSWETAADANEFQHAYRAILAAHDATETDDGIYVVDDGGFSGAYAIDTDETSVTVVHAPTPAGLFKLSPGLDPDPVEDSIPGFGAGISLAALAAAALVYGRLSR